MFNYVQDDLVLIGFNFLEKCSLYFVRLLFVLFINMKYYFVLKFIARWKKQIHDSGGWLVLGILSSCGFGTGLHTFLLYLGPFVGKVTLAANECNSVNFLTPPYPDE